MKVLQKKVGEEQVYGTPTLMNTQVIDFSIVVFEFKVYAEC